MAGIDYLTFTLPTEFGRSLSRGEGFILAEEGSARPGFQHSEKWLVPGGEAWRRTSPRVPSKVFGLAYESWECAGHPAGSFSRRCRPLQGYPTRLDVAFDFSVPSDFIPEHVGTAVADHAARRGLKRSVSGDYDSATQYFGSRKSDRNLRIYRRDLKDPELGEVFGPLMRIEIELRGKTGKAAWGHYRSGGLVSLLRVAGAHIREMIGLDLVDGITTVPELVAVPEDRRGSKAVCEWIRQNAVMLQLCDELGLDLGSLAALAVEGKSPVAIRKHVQRMGERRRALQGVTFETCRAVMLPDIGRARRSTPESAARKRDGGPR